jgi:hypothetical protein
LIANGSTKFLDSNRASNADPQDNTHAAVWVHTAQASTSGGTYLGAGGFGIAGTTNIGSGVTTRDTFLRSRSQNIDELGSTAGTTGLIGISRSAGANYDYRNGASSGNLTRASQTSTSNNTYVFARNVSDAIQLPTDGRLAFFSIGEAMNLSLLSARVSTLTTAIGVAIP